ncbi:putative membrane protein [Sediminihabitans luteus]|uniref:Putative membrane protein n=1 Tax=Sediminihabitans luteus TaxID=1138585 RepID=A0A2M9CEF1_9CELL|nr:YhgE/Pip domain-containing protein [Sediminihabitans luteus]PJJ70273.1 putative membrane protein [Sediminihabitans luteus]GII97744.1 ABC transporter [Sediminihabitans luteus]
MTPLRLSLSELRRLTSGTLPRLAVLAMAIIPTLYAGLYLFANHDPYGRLDEVPAAVVVQDRGATTTDPATGATSTVSYGQDVADQLEDDGGFAWVPTSEAAAEEGVRDGTFDAALIVGPDFSADLVSAGELAPHQASLRLVTNDANNYLATTIANTIVGEVRDAVASQVGEEAATQFLDGFAEIHTNLADALDGADQLLDGSGRLADGVTQAHDGATTLAAGAQDAADGAADLADGASALHTATGTLADGATDLSTGATALDTGASTLADGATDLSAGLDRLRDATSDLPADARTLADGARQVADGNASVAGYGDQAAQAADDLVAGLADARTDLERTLLDQGVPQDTVDAVLAALDDQVGPLTDAADDVRGAADQLDALSAGAQDVADGAETLADAAPDLAQGVADAADGGDDLAAGASDLATGAGTLADGASDLAAGATSLDTGAGTLATGAGTLATGTGDLSAGASTLADGTSDLVDGAGDLVDGTTDLRDGLADGLAQVPNPDDDTAAATAETLGDPVAVDASELSSAGTYGGGLAPFFLSLATWIGAYVLFLLVRPLSTRALAAGRPAWQAAVGGWLTPFLVGVVQVLAMLAVTWFGLGITPVHGIGAALFLVLLTATFVAILQALNVWLGAAGQFLGLVLMLVQLVSAGGTFPWQTLPEPLRTFHHMLPMTYGVEGLRHLLFGGDPAAVWTAVAVLVAFLVGALAVTTWAASRQRVWTVTRLQPELVL